LGGFGGSFLKSFCCDAHRGRTEVEELLAMAEDFLLDSVDFSSDESDDSSSSLLVSSSFWILQRSITDEATFLPLLELLDEVRPISTGWSSELVLLDESDPFRSG